MSWAEVKVLRDNLARIGYTEQTISTANTRPELYIGTLPISIAWNKAVVLNDEIHILVGTSHYKWDGSSWTQVSTTPISVNNCVVFNDEIHIFSRMQYSTATSHYKWDGSSWTQVSSLVFGANYDGSMVVFNDAIHVISGITHHKWDGSSWTSLPVLPSPYLGKNAYNISVIVFENAIHVLGGDMSSTIGAHLKWDGSTWSSGGSGVPNGLNGGNLFIYDGRLYAINGSNRSFFYVLENGAWKQLQNLPVNASSSSTVVVDDSVYYMQAKNMYKCVLLVNRDIAFSYTGQRHRQYLPIDTMIYCDRNRTRVLQISDAEFENTDEGYRITKSGIVTVDQIDADGQYYAIG